MQGKITTYSKLWCLVDLDHSHHELKNMAMFFLDAMHDWPTKDQQKIEDFVADLKAYFGSPISIDHIRAIKFDGNNSWQIESGGSIVDLINESTQFYNESEFDNILATILNYYERKQ